MKFSKLAEYFEKIEQTSSRITITQVLAELFNELSADEIEKTAYLLQGRICPLFESLEFGMAEKSVIKAIAHALQIDSDHFTKEFKKLGDVGQTAEHFKKSHPSLDAKDLTIAEVFADLLKMAKTSGPGSQDLKMNILATLVRQLDPLSVRYLVRIPMAVLRLGFSDMTILDAYSWMITGDKKLRPAAEKAYHVRPDLGLIGRVIKEKGIQAVEKIKPSIFTPIIMMRAERLPSAEDIIKKIGTCALEAKYDGFRLQVHYDKKKHEVRLYSRNLEDVTFMYPDLVEGVLKEARAESMIFEGEAIGYDPNTNSFLPFQETVQRKRKHGIEEKAKEIPLKLFTYELLYLNGDDLLNVPFHDRRKALEKSVKTTGDNFKDTLIMTTENITEDYHQIEQLFEDAISKGLEGIMAKKLDGIYQAGARGYNWIKFKRSYSAKIEDTIDCLVMGYDIGRGKRADFGIGAFLVGIYDEKEDKFVTMAKIGTGLSDDEWRELYKRCEKFKSAKQPALYEVDKLMSVDVWTKPEIIVEIKADEITRSSVHTAGRVLKASKSGSAFDVDVSGYALRFPRLVKFRNDKRPEEVTTLKEVADMFKHQKEL